jgi:hypothetical protein
MLNVHTNYIIGLSKAFRNQGSTVNSADGQYTATWDAICGSD